MYTYIYSWYIYFINGDINLINCINTCIICVFSGPMTIDKILLDQTFFLNHNKQNHTNIVLESQKIKHTTAPRTPHEIAMWQGLAIARTPHQANYCSAQIYCVLQYDLSGIIFESNIF